MRCITFLRQLLPFLLLLLLPIFPDKANALPNHQSHSVDTANDTFLQRRSPVLVRRMFGRRKSGDGKKSKEEKQFEKKSKQLGLQIGRKGSSLSTDQPQTLPGPGPQQSGRKEPIPYQQIQSKANYLTERPEEWKIQQNLNKYRAEFDQQQQHQEFESGPSPINPYFGGTPGGRGGLPGPLGGRSGGRGGPPGGRGDQPGGSVRPRLGFGGPQFGQRGPSGPYQHPHHHGDPDSPGSVDSPGKKYAKELGMTTQEYEQYKKEWEDKPSPLQSTHKGTPHQSPQKSSPQQSMHKIPKQQSMQLQRAQESFNPFKPLPADFNPFMPHMRMQSSFEEQNLNSPRAAQQQYGQSLHHFPGKQMSHPYKGPLPQQYQRSGSASDDPRQEFDRYVGPPQRPSHSLSHQLGGRGQLPQQYQYSGDSYVGHDGRGGFYHRSREDNTWHEDSERRYRQLSTAPVPAVTQDGGPVGQYHRTDQYGRPLLGRFQPPPRGPPF